MNKNNQEGYYGRRSREREERSRERGRRDDRRYEDRNSRLVKKRRRDSVSDTESHHDVQILYKKVERGREEAGPSRNPPQNFLALPAPPKYQRGKGLLGDAPDPPPKPIAGQFPLVPLLHPPGPPSLNQDYYHSQGYLSQEHAAFSDMESRVQDGHHGTFIEDVAMSKPPITSLLMAMSGSTTERCGSHTEIFPKNSQVSPDNVKPAKKQKDGSWSLPPMPKIKKLDVMDNPKEEEEPPWKSQIKELRSYIVKLENEKKDLIRDVETEKVQQLRDYIMKIEVEKQDLLNEVAQSQNGISHGKTNEGQMIELITKNIETVKKAQEEENREIESKKDKLVNEEKRLAIEKRKLDKAKEDLKTSLDNGMKFLSSEKNKMEMALQRKNQSKAVANDRMLTRIKALEKAVKEEQDSRTAEEKRHLATELEELETRKEMTIKTLESESKVEELESTLERQTTEVYEMKQKLAKKDAENRNLLFEISKVSKENEELECKFKSTQDKLDTALEKKKQEQIAQKHTFDAEYAVFVKKREDFEETEKIRCVFCPQENLQPISNFIFHIAREHMFDQYKNRNTIDESLKVGMFLKVLEEKARKELGLEMKSLNDSLDELKENAFKHEEELEEKEVLINELEGKTGALERDIETLLESEANNKTQIEHLVLRNNTLQNQMRQTPVSETVRIENQEMGKKINVLGREVNDLKERRLTLEREVDGLRQRWKEESSDKLGWKNKYVDLFAENENLKNRMEAQHRNTDNVKETLKVELVNANDEKSKLRQKINNLEEKVDELVSLKVVVESQLIETKAENEAIKEFRTDLNTVNDVVCDDMRVENKTLKTKVGSGLTEIKNLKSELSKVKTSKNFVVHELTLAEKEVNKLKAELSNIKTENISAQQRLAEAMEKIQSFERDMESCLKEQNEFDGESGFTFDLGIDSILKAPLDVINLQIENIDIDQLDNIDLEGEASDQQVNENVVTKEVGNLSEDSVVLASVEIRIGDTEMEKEDSKEVEKEAGWSDEDFDYDLLNDSQEDSVHKAVEKGKVATCDGPHPAGCDCVDCDDCDVLHGYVQGQPQGIREMMRQNSI